MDPQQVSDDLFGRPCRLPLAIWILQHAKGRFFQSEPPENLGGRTAIRQELKRFRDAGLVLEERPDGDPRVYYVRSDSPLWQIVASAADVLGRDEP